MFNDMANEVFEKAGVDPEKHRDLWTECRDILQFKMAAMSATMRLSWERVRVFELQKKTLIDDLVEMKANGTLW